MEINRDPADEKSKGHVSCTFDGEGVRPKTLVVGDRYIICILSLSVSPLPSKLGWQSFGKQPDRKRTVSFTRRRVSAVITQRWHFSTKATLTICKQVDLAVLQQNFIYKNREQAWCGHRAALCRPPFHSKECTKPTNVHLTAASCVVTHFLQYCFHAIEAVIIVV